MSPVGRIGPTCVVHACMKPVRELGDYCLTHWLTLPPRRRKSLQDEAAWGVERTRADHEEREREWAEEDARQLTVPIDSLAVAQCAALEDLFDLPAVEPRRAA